jgi:hypothetical protein
MRNLSTFMMGAGLLAMFGATRAPDEGDGAEELSIITLDEDLSDVEKPPELPVGKYEGEVQEVGVQTSQKGNQFYAIKIIIPQENIPASVQEHFPDGAVLYWNRQLVVTPTSDRRTKFNLRKMMEAFGLDTSVREIDPTQWMGCSVGVVIKSGKYQGETRSEIGSLYPLEAAAPAPKAASAKGKAAGGRARR